MDSFLASRLEVHHYSHLYVKVRVEGERPQRLQSCWHAERELAGGRVGSDAGLGGLVEVQAAAAGALFSAVVSFKSVT